MNLNDTGQQRQKSWNEIMKDSEVEIPGEAGGSSDTDPGNFEGFQTVETRKRYRSLKLTRSAEGVSVAGINIQGGQMYDDNGVIIIKPLGDNAEAFVKNPRDRLEALNKSAFVMGEIIRITPNKEKCIVVVTLKSARMIKDLKLLEVTKIGNWNVKCYQPFNSRVESGVLQNVDVELEINYIEEGLKGLDIPYERIIRLNKHISGNRVATTNVRIDFLCPLSSLPREIYIDYVAYPLRKYHHVPLRCFKCQGFYHSSNSCRSVIKCSKCGEGHSSADCTVRDVEFKCPNCKGLHPSYSKDCPSYRTAVVVDRLARDKKISYAAALRSVKNDQHSHASSSSQGHRLSSGPSVSGGKISTAPPNSVNHIMVSTGPVMVDASVQTNSWSANINTNSSYCKFNSLDELLLSEDFAIFLHTLVTSESVKKGKHGIEKVRHHLSDFHESISIPIKQIKIPSTADTSSNDTGPAHPTFSSSPLSSSSFSPSPLPSLVSEQHPDPSSKSKKKNDSPATGAKRKSFRVNGSPSQNGKKVAKNISQ